MGVLTLMTLNPRPFPKGDGLWWTTGLKTGGLHEEETFHLYT